VTATVGRSESRDWRNTAQRRSRIGPCALQPHRVVGVPNTDHFRDLPEIVDVPVGATRLMQMMRNACSQTPRAEGAAEVQIKLWLKVDSAQAPDLQFDRCLKHEYERVRARRCLQRIIHETLRNRDGITGSMIGKGFAVTSLRVGLKTSIARRQKRCFSIREM